LKGKRIGTPEYQSLFSPRVAYAEADIVLVTAPVWQRGIMEDEFDVPISSVQWYVGAIEKSNHPRISKISHSLPPGVTVTAIKQGQNLSEMLANGEIDAIFSASRPSSLDTSPNVKRLFDNFKEVEAEYYKRTNIFPIMHVVALKRTIYEANPWVAKTLTKAFDKALNMAYEALRERSALRYMLPWLEDHVEETQKLMGGDSKWWKDGFTENRHVIDKFLEYHYKQGLSKRRYMPEEIFAPSALETYVL
jgi:4,5-dihydroxyphthalate decarboxylase